MDPLVTDHTSFFSVDVIQFLFLNSAKHDALHNLFNTHLSYDFFYQFNLKVLALDLIDRGTCYSLVFYNTEIPGLLLFT